ncbi:MAG: hypothetical protein GX595_13370 [Lentisphaerae bacterium]|nr:hypothetical protein [Lentisphaerota bacterium]
MLIHDTILSQAASVRPRRGQRALQLIVGRLATAVSCGLPMAAALRALETEPEWSRPGMDRWRRRLAFLAGDLEAGATLSEALERRLADHLPAHVIPAVRAAEAADCLPRVLATVANALRTQRPLRRQLRAALAYPAMQALTLLFVLSGLLIFIVPRFVRMFDELVPWHYSPYRQILGLLSQPPGPVLLGLERAFVAVIGAVTQTSPRLLLNALVVVTALVVLAAVLRPPHPRRHPRRRLHLDVVYSRLPVVGGFWRRLGLVEAASAMGAFLAAGADLARAARSAAETVETAWAREHLRHFAADLEAGRPWDEAWITPRTSAPLCDWMIRNAAARERPLEGFQSVADWTADALARRCRCLMRWLEPVLILANGVIIGGVVMLVAGALFDTLYAMVLTP